MQLNRRRHDIDTEELEGGSYDEPEAQFTQFHRPREELGDGSRKMWLYFAALPDRTASAPSLADGQTFVPESRRLNQSDAGFSCSPSRPFATPSQGETTAIAELARKGVFVAYDRKLTRELTALLSGKPAAPFGIEREIVTGIQPGSG